MFYDYDYFILLCMAIKLCLCASISSVHSEVLKSNPEILSLVAKHLFCQLESFVNNKDPDMSRRWEVWCLYNV